MSPMSELESRNAPPADRPDRFGAVRILLGLAGAPAAWTAQIALSEPLTAYACYPYRMPLSAPLWAELPWLLAAIHAACIGLALFSGCVGWSMRRQTARRPAEAGGSPSGSNEDRNRFLAMLALMSSFIFITAVIFNACALLLVPLCGSPP
jgi:hypothetical protein